MKPIANTLIGNMNNIEISSHCPRVYKKIDLKNIDLLAYNSVGYKHRQEAMSLAIISNILH